MDYDTDHRPKVCDRCRIKKIGCDGALPSCGKCVIAGADCTSSTSLRRKTTPRRFGKSKNDEVERLKAQVSRLQERLAQQHGSHTQEQPVLGKDAPVAAQYGGYAGDVALLPHRTSPDTGTIETTDSKPSSVIRHLGRLVHVPSGSMFAGSTTGVHFIRSVEQKWQSLADSSESFPECLFRMHLLPSTAMSRTTTNPPATTNHSWESLLQLPKDYYLGRLQHFLTFWGTAYPIFCSRQITRAVSSTLGQVQSAQTHPDRSTLHKILLIMAIESCSVQDFVDDNHAPVYYNAARALESEAFDELSVEAVQSHILNAIFLQLAGKHALLASAVGAAVRAAQCIGLHRHPRRFKMCAGETELRTRLWWCISLLDISASIAYGLPKIISDTDVDVGYPTNCDFEDIEITELPVPLPGESTQASMFIAFAKLSSIMQQFTRLLFTTTERRDGEAKISKLDRHLRVWHYEHSDLIAQGKSDGQSNSLALHLQILAHFCLLLIHQPGLTLEEQNLQFSKSLTTSLHCAINLLQILTESRGIQALPCLQSNIPRLVFQSGLVCLYYSWHNQTINLPEADCFSETGAKVGKVGNKTTLKSIIDLACSLLTFRLGTPATNSIVSPVNDQDILHEPLQEAARALFSMSDKTYKHFRGSGLNTNDASAGFLDTFAMDSVEDWPSSLWQLNADDISEWTEGFTFHSMDTFLPEFSLE